MNKAILGLVIVLIVGAGAGFAVINSNSDTNETSAKINETSSSEATTEEEQTSTTPESTASTITKDEVATHNSEDDCWTIIDGMVYNITSYIPRHPGGDEILRACGTDGTTLFQTRTTEDGEKVGTGRPHSSSAEKMLEGFALGPLE